jgi:hypothetical protein
MGGAGSSTYGLVFGGSTGTLQATTEAWDGTSWTEVGDLTTAREALGGLGTSTLALAFAGATPANTAVTEEWTAPDVVINTLTTS